ncbi:MAG: hypothetical protein QOD06_2350, partial [Candidatus Binatota bacterium]|nr:hypothetical protein [Candidatus Binatota bacterium]
MNRRRDLWRVLTAVVVTFAATEWLHLRLGDPTIFSLSRPATTQVITDPADDYQLVTPSEFHTYL